MRTVKKIDLTLNYTDTVVINPSCGRFLKPLQEGWNLGPGKIDTPNAVPPNMVPRSLFYFLCIRRNGIGSRHS